jgi:hypothetical protein
MHESRTADQARRLREIEQELDQERDDHGPVSIVALALTAGFVLFLVADALPGGLGGHTGFVLGFLGVAGLAFAALLVAVAAERRSVRSEQDELDRIILIAMLLRRLQARDLPGGNLPAGEDEAALMEREVREISDQLREARRKERG